MGFRHALIDRVTKRFVGNHRFVRLASAFHKKQWDKRNPAARGKVGLLAIMKNEAMNIVEWVQHYEWQGVDHIFLIDNASTDDSLKKIEPWIKSGFISCYQKSAPHQQLSHYRKVFSEANINEQVEWLVVADLDEFWYAKQGNIKHYLSQTNSDVDVIYSPWRTFGSSGLVDHPSSVRKGFTTRWPESLKEETKWICRTSAIASVEQIGVHKLFGIDSSRALTDSVGLCLNHYVIQSKSYFERIKMTRGDVANIKQQNIRDWDYFARYDAPATIYDNELASRL